MRYNFRTIVIILGLLVLPAVGRAQSGNTPANAQCPAPSKYVDTFQDSKCVAITLEYELKLTRVFSSDGDSFKQGHFFTTTPLLSRSYAIRRLALKKEWGNRATTQVDATIPRGTTIYIGIVAPQDPPQLYPGGAQQTVVEDVTGIIWGRMRSVPKSPVRP